MKQKAIRMTVAFLIFWAILPVLTGGCPCAHAGQMPLQGLSLQKVPCHGCCPEIKTGQPHQAFEPVEPIGFQTSRQQARLHLSSLKGLLFNEFSIDGPEAKTPPGVLPAGTSHFSSTPIYLTLQVLRF